MTGSDMGCADSPAMDDSLVELAILGILAERCEIYPSFLVGELRRRAPALPERRIRPVLERLWAERRVARLWHRYMLPRDVPAVREQWLAMVDRQRPEFERSDGGLHAWAESRDILRAWNGWTMGEEIA